MKVEVTITLEKDEELNVPLMHELMETLKKYPKNVIKKLNIEVE